MALFTNILSICSGIGGLDIGVSRAIAKSGFNSRTVCYIEREAFAASILVKQMESGKLDEAPIWSDLEKFDCNPWRGKVDIVIGGIPCQPYSQAGKGKSERDSRDMWPEMFRVIKETGSKFAFLENVRGFSKRGLPRVARDLSKIGFNAEWGHFTARDVGAPHIRNRFFILAYSQRLDLRKFSEWLSKGRAQAFQREREAKPRNNGQDSYSDGRGCKEFGFKKSKGESGSQRREPDRLVAKWRQQNSEKRNHWIEVEPPLCGVVDGVPNRNDRLRALGNAVVPQCAEKAFLHLFGRLI